MTMAMWLAAAAVMAALASWFVARRAAREAREAMAMYWRLRFEHGELKARVERLAPDPAAPPTAAGTQFVPLSSVKR